MVSPRTSSLTVVPRFTSGVWRAFCRGIGATVSLSGYHPQTNGQAKRANQVLEASLRCVTTSNPASWSLHLPWVEYSHNTMVSSATSLSPFLCSLGYQPPLFPSQETEAAVTSVRAHLRRCQRIWKVARDAMTLNRDRVQQVTNRRPQPTIQVRGWDLPLPTISHKLAPRYVGPYTIDKVINPSALRLTLPPSLKIHPVFHVSQVKPVATSDLSPLAHAPSPLRTFEGGDLVWEVNRILAVRRHGQGFHYLVDWVGYGPEDRTWVPHSYFAEPALLEEFYKANPRAIGRLPGVSRREGGPVAGAAMATPPTQPARSKNCAGELISSPKLHTI